MMRTSVYAKIASSAQLVTLLASNDTNAATAKAVLRAVLVFIKTVATVKAVTKTCSSTALAAPSALTVSTIKRVRTHLD